MNFSGYESEIQRTITSLSNCLNLLLPPPENFFIPENSSSVSFQSSIDEQSSSINFNSDKEEVNPSNLRPFGITTDYSLVLEYNPNDKIKVTKTEENSSILENAKDCAQLISCRFLPMVKNWSKAFNKYSSR